MEAFRIYLNRTSSPSTAKHYQENVEEFLVFLAGRHPTVDNIEEWIGVLQSRGIRPQTVQWKVSAIRRYLGYLARHGDTEASHTLAVIRDYRITPPARERDRKPKRVVSREEVRKLMDKASARDRALVAVLWGTGARLSEILGNRISQIRPMLAEELKQLAEGAVIERPGKGGRMRRLVLLPNFRAAVKPWSDSRPDGQPAFPITQQGFHKSLCKTANEAGVPKLSPHAFRHGYKTTLETRGVPREVLKALLGHGPRDITDVYGEVQDDRLKDAIVGVQTGGRQ